MGNNNSFNYYNQIPPLRPEEAAQYSKDISCIVEPKNNRGGVFLGNARAAANVQLLKCIFTTIQITASLQS